VATSLLGGVKFVASSLHLEGKVFGYKGVAIVALHVITRLHMCDFWRLLHFCLLTLVPTFVF